ncbi:DNA-binding Lrp family transcriptional regulator [Mesorhizobium sp. USDA 4775]
MPLKADLDAIDWKILRELQADGRMTNVELSNRVGISAPPCLRRVKRLEEAGIIRGYRALLNAPALGLDVVAFCLVGLHHQADAELRTFAERTRGWPIVRDAWMVSGESDFLLHCVASDLGAFQTFVIEELTSTPNVDTVRTALTIRRVKDEGPGFLRASLRSDERLRAGEFLAFATSTPRWYSTDADVQGWTALPDFVA